MTQRAIGGNTYTLIYDAENRLVSVTGPSLSANFTYDGDGNRVKSTINGAITTFVGNHYEVSGSTVTKYYYAGASRVAMSVNGTVSYLLTDQLGSTSGCAAVAALFQGMLLTYSTEIDIEGKACRSTCECIVSSMRIPATYSGRALSRTTVGDCFAESARNDVERVVREIASQRALATTLKGL